MSSKTEAQVKMEQEEMQPGTSGGGEQQEKQQEEQVEEGEESFNSDVIDKEFLEEYCEEVEHIEPMTVSKELFYMDRMVARNYAQLSKTDKERFDQMKRLAEIRGSMI